jgi:predicted permease
VVVQLTLTLVLLAGAGLLVRSVASQYQYNPGIDTSDMITMTLDLPETMYPGADERRLFYRRLEEHLATLPGMRTTFASSAPLLGAFARPATAEGVPEAETPTSRTSNVFVGPRYFEVLGVSPVRGRTFTDADGAASATVVVNERFAEMYLPGRDPIGRRIRLEGRFAEPATDWLTIVGIVPNLHHEDNDPREVEDAVYVPYAASPRPSAAIIVRSRLDTMTVARALGDRMRSIDPDLPLFGVTTLDDAFAQTFRTVELFGSLFAIFAGAALLLATIGLYGVTSYSVAQRRHEIGVRIALGARSSQVWWTVARRIVMQLALGLVLGLAGAAATGRLLEGFLWGVGERDPLTFVSVTTLLVAVALVASVVPTRRAMRLDPIAALRAE